MAHWAWYLIGAIGLAVIYDRYVTPEQKREWETQIKKDWRFVAILPCGKVVLEGR